MCHSPTVPMLILAAVLVVLSGCERPDQPAQQHRELRRIDRSSNDIVPRLVDDVPIQFDKIGVWVVGPNDSTLGAKARWHLADASASVQNYLRSKVTAARPKLTGGLATGLVLRCSYFDEAGVGTGVDDLSIRIAEAGKVSVTFENLGVGGRVHRVDVELRAIVWQCQGREVTVPIESG